jgi:hypothetical protein
MEGYVHHMITEALRKIPLRDRRLVEIEGRLGILYYKDTRKRVQLPALHPFAVDQRALKCDFSPEADQWTLDHARIRFHQAAPLGETLVTIDEECYTGGVRVRKSRTHAQVGPVAVECVRKETLGQVLIHQPGAHADMRIVVTMEHPIDMGRMLNKRSQKRRRQFRRRSITNPEGTLRLDVSGPLPGELGPTSVEVECLWAGEDEAAVGVDDRVALGEWTLDKTRRLLDAVRMISHE